MNGAIPDPPKPEAEQPEAAPGGPDADVNESDVGAASQGDAATPDVPLSAQRDQAHVPDEVQTPEETESDDTDGSSEPSA